MDIFLICLLILLFVISVTIIFTNSYRKAILLSGALSLLASVVYLILGASDVALAEAVIGCTFSTIVMLMAIKHLRVINVAYRINDIDYQDFTEVFMNAYSREDYDVHFTTSNESIEHVLDRYDNLDYYLIEENTKILLYHFNKSIDPDLLRDITSLSNKNLEIIDKWEGR